MSMSMLIVHVNVNININITIIDRIYWLQQPPRVVRLTPSTYNGEPRSTAHQGLTSRNGTSCVWTQLRCTCHVLVVCPSFPKLAEWQPTPSQRVLLCHAGRPTATFTLFHLDSVSHTYISSYQIIHIISSKTCWGAPQPQHLTKWCQYSVLCHCCYIIVRWLSSFNQYNAVEIEYHFACTPKGVYLMSTGKMISALLDLWLSPILMFLTFILLTFHCNRGPISYRFRHKRLLQSKIAKFPITVYLAPLLKGFPLESGTGACG